MPHKLAAKGLWYAIVSQEVSAVPSARIASKIVTAMAAAAAAHEMSFSNFRLLSAIMLKRGRTGTTTIKRNALHYLRCWTQRGFEDYLLAP